MRWYLKNRRFLPWRRDPTPYRVWISEIMLQQTQSRTVVPYYDRFLRRFPDIASLADAPEEEVIELWAGLGYYSRARNLLRAARHIVKYHNGVFPTEYASILALPGIGRYTAGAICSIAMNQPYPIVDGNIRRVVSRLKGLRKNIPEKYFWDRMTAWVPEKRASVFNQAIMELGAVICLPTQPLCSQCPIHSFCRANEQNLQNSIPAPKSGPAVKKIELVIFVLKRKGKILLVRQSDSLIPGAWGLPCRAVSGKRSMSETADALNQELSGAGMEMEYVSSIRHSITHHRIRAHIYTGKVSGTISGWSIDAGRMCWATGTQQGKKLTSSLFEKSIQACRRRL